MAELKDLVDEAKIQRTKTNNFLRTKRDICLALTLSGLQKFKDRMEHTLSTKFQTVQNDPVAAKAVLDKQVTDAIVNTKTSLKVVKKVVDDVQKQVDRTRDDHLELVKYKPLLTSSATDDATRGLQNQFSSQLEALQSRLETLQQKEAALDSIAEELRAKFNGLYRTKTELNAGPLSDTDFLRADVQQIKLNEREIMNSLSELRDHMYRIKTEASRAPDMRLNVEMDNLTRIKTDLEAQNKELKSRLQTLTESAGVAANALAEHTDLLKSKEDTISGLKSEIDRLKRDGNDDVNALKKNLHEATLHLNEFLQVFPDLQAAKDLLSEKQNLESRIDTMKNSLRTANRELTKITDRLDNIEETVIAVDSSTDATSIEHLLKRIDKLLDKFDTQRQEIEQLTKNLKSADSQISSLHLDFLRLVKLTDENLVIDPTHMPDKADMISKLRSYITNSQYLNKAVTELKSDKAKVDDSYSKVQARVEKINNLLDSVETQTGGADKQTSTRDIMATLDAFESRITKIKDDRARLLEQIKQSKEALAAREAEIDREHEKSLRALETRNADLEAQLDALRTHFAQQQTDLQQAVEELNNDNQSDRDKYESLVARVAKIMDQQKASLENIQDLEGKLAHTQAVEDYATVSAAATPNKMLDTTASSRMKDKDLQVQQANTELKQHVAKQAALERKLDDHEEQEQTITENLENLSARSPTNPAEQRANDQEIDRLRSALQDVQTKKQQIEAQYAKAEQDVQEKLTLVNKLQQELIDLKEKDSLRLQEVKQALEQTYEQQLKQKENDLDQIHHQLELQATQDKAALKAEEESLKSASDRKMQDIIRNVESLKQQASAAESAQEKAKLEERAQLLQEEKELHQKFQDAMQKKDAEMQAMSTELHKALSGEQEKYEQRISGLQAALDKDHLDEPGHINEALAAQKADLQQQHINTINQLESTMSARYEALKNTYLDLKNRYDNDINAIRQKALNYEDEVKQNAQQEFDKYHDAVRVKQVLEEQANTLKSRNQALMGKVTEFYNMLVTTKKELEELKLVADKENLARLKDKYTALNQQVKENELELNEKRGANSALEAKVTQLEETISALQGQQHAAETAQARLAEQQLQNERLLKSIGQAKAATLEEQSKKIVLGEQLADIRAAISKYKGARTINPSQPHEIRTEDAVKGIQDIVRDYDFFRTDYDNIVGKMKDNIVTLVKTLTDKDTLDLDAIDRQMLESLKPEEAKAKLQQYEATLIKELKEQADERLNQARWVSIAYGAEQDFADLEHDIKKIVDSDRTVGYYKTKLDFINRLLQKIDRTRQRLAATEASPLKMLKGDKTQRDAKVNMLRAILDATLKISFGNVELWEKIAICKRLIPDDKMRYENFDDAREQKIKLLFKFLLDQLKVIHETRPEDLFENYFLEDKLVKSFVEVKNEYVKAEDELLINYRDNMKWSDKIMSEIGTMGVGEPPESLRQQSVLQTTVVGGGNSEPLTASALSAIVQRLLTRVESLRDALDRQVTFFLAQVDLTKPAPTVDLSSFSRASAISLPKRIAEIDRISSDISGSRSPAAEPLSPSQQQEVSETSTRNVPITDPIRATNAFLYQYLKDRGLQVDSSVSGGTRENHVQTGGQLTRQDHVDVFNNLLDWALHAFVQLRLYSPTDLTHLKARFKSYYYDPIATKLYDSIKNVTADTRFPLPIPSDTSKDIQTIFSDVSNRRNNLLKQQTTGGGREEVYEQLRQVTSYLDNLKSQKLQSRNYLRSVLKSQEALMSHLMRFRPNRKIKTYGGDDGKVGEDSVSDKKDVIKARNVNPYDVDNLNKILEGLNRYMTVQMKSLKQYKQDSLQTKDYQRRLIKLDSALIEQQVHVRRLQELTKESVDRALTIEDQLITRDAVIDRVRLYLLGMRGDNPGLLSFNKTLNVFSSIKNKKGDLAYPELIWEDRVADSTSSSVIRDSASVSVLRHWFDKHKHLINFPVLLQVMDHVLSYYQYLRNSQDESVLHAQQEEILKLKNLLEKSVSTLSGSFSATDLHLAELAEMNRQWFDLQVRPGTSAGLNRFQNQFRALFTKSAEKATRVLRGEAQARVLEGLMAAARKRRDVLVVRLLQLTGYPDKHQAHFYAREMSIRAWQIFCHSYSQDRYLWRETMSSSIKKARDSLISENTNDKDRIVDGYDVLTGWFTLWSQNFKMPSINLKDWDKSETFYRDWVEYLMKFLLNSEAKFVANSNLLTILQDPKYIWDIYDVKSKKNGTFEHPFDGKDKNKARLHLLQFLVLLPQTSAPDQETPILDVDMDKIQCYDNDTIPEKQPPLPYGWALVSSDAAIPLTDNNICDWYGRMSRAAVRKYRQVVHEKLAIIDESNIAANEDSVNVQLCKLSELLIASNVWSVLWDLNLMVTDIKSKLARPPADHPSVLVNLVNGTSLYCEKLNETSWPVDAPRLSEIDMGLSAALDALTVLFTDICVAIDTTGDVSKLRKAYSCRDITLRLSAKYEDMIKLTDFSTSPVQQEDLRSTLLRQSLSDICNDVQTSLTDSILTYINTLSNEEASIKFRGGHISGGHSLQSPVNLIVGDKTQAGGAGFSDSVKLLVEQIGNVGNVFSKWKNTPLDTDVYEDAVEDLSTPNLEEVTRDIKQDPELLQQKVAESEAVINAGKKELENPDLTINEQAQISNAVTAASEFKELLQDDEKKKASQSADLAAKDEAEDEEKQELTAIRKAYSTAVADNVNLKAKISDIKNPTPENATIVYAFIIKTDEVVADVELPLPRFNTEAVPENTNDSSETVPESSKDSSETVPEIEALTKANAEPDNETQAPKDIVATPDQSEYISEASVPASAPPQPAPQIYIAVAESDKPATEALYDINAQDQESDKELQAAAQEAWTSDANAFAKRVKDLQTDVDHSISDIGSLDNDRISEFDERLGLLTKERTGLEETRVNDQLPPLQQLTSVSQALSNLKQQKELYTGSAQLDQAKLQLSKLIEEGSKIWTQASDTLETLNTDIKPQHNADLNSAYFDSQRQVTDLRNYLEQAKALVALDKPQSLEKMSTQLSNMQDSSQNLKQIMVSCPDSLEILKYIVDVSRFNESLKTLDDRLTHGIALVAADTLQDSEKLLSAIERDVSEAETERKQLIARQPASAAVFPRDPTTFRDRLMQAKTALLTARDNFAHALSDLTQQKTRSQELTDSAKATSALLTNATNTAQTILKSLNNRELIEAGDRAIKEFDTDAKLNELSQVILEGERIHNLANPNDRQSIQGMANEMNEYLKKAGNVAKINSDIDEYISKLNKLQATQKDQDEQEARKNTDEETAKLSKIDKIWKEVSDHDYRKEREIAETAVMTALRDLQNNPYSRKVVGGQGSDDTVSWAEKLKTLMYVCASLYTYSLQYFKRPSVLRLLSTKDFSSLLLSANAAERDCLEFLDLVFVDVTDLPQKETFAGDLTVKRFMAFVYRDSKTWALQKCQMALSAGNDASQFVRTDEYFKFFVYLLSSKYDIILAQMDTYRDLIIHLHANVQKWTQKLTDNVPNQLFQRLKRSTIDDKHMKQGVASVLTYVKIRCDKPTYWNERFRLSYNPNTQHDLYVEFNNHKFQYYDYVQKSDTYTPNARALESFGDHRGTANQALANTAPYQYHYYFGPFTRVFPNTAETDYIAKECTHLRETLSAGQSVMVIGYGASGAGKTSTLICRSKSERCGNEHAGVLMKLLQMPDFAKSYPKVSLSVFELFADPENELSPGGLANPQKIKNMRFVYSGQDYVFDTSKGYANGIDNIGFVDQPPVKGKKRLVKNLQDQNEVITANRYVNVVNADLFSVKDDLQLTNTTTLSLVIQHAVDKDRLTRSTTNNPNSSRSHILVFIKLKPDVPDSPTLVVGDFAGVENRFACKNLKTLMTMYNRELERVNTRTVIEEDIRNNKLKKGGAQLELYASQNLSPDAESVKIAEQLEIKLKDPQSPWFKDDKKLIKSAVTEIRKFIPFGEQVQALFQMTGKSEADLYLSGEYETIKGSVLSSLELYLTIVEACFDCTTTTTNKTTKEKDQTTDDKILVESLEKVTGRKITRNPLKKAGDSYDDGLEIGRYLKTLREEQKITNWAQAQKFFGLPDFDSLGQKKKAHVAQEIVIKYAKLRDLFSTKTAGIRVRELLQSIIDAHFIELDSRNVLVNEAVAVCSARTREGSYINSSLQLVRDLIRDFVVAQTNDMSKLRTTPPFPDLCMPALCNPLAENCFEIDDCANSDKCIKSDVTWFAGDVLKSRRSPKDIMQYVFDSLGEKQAHEMKIAVFCVFNMNRSANDPPPTAFIDVEDLRAEINRKKNTNTTLFRLREYLSEEHRKEIEEIATSLQATNLKQVNPEVIKDIRSQIDAQADMMDEGLLEHLKFLCSDDRLYVDLLRDIDRLNATHPIGTLQFTDNIAKFSLTDSVCRMSSTARLELAKGMFDQVKSLANQDVGEIGQFSNLMDPAQRMREYLTAPQDPAPNRPLSNATNSTPAKQVIRGSLSDTKALATSSGTALKPNPNGRSVSRSTVTKGPAAKRSFQHGGVTEFAPMDLESFLAQWQKVEGQPFSEYIVQVHQETKAAETRSNKTRRPKRRTRK